MRGTGGLEKGRPPHEHEPTYASLGIYGLWASGIEFSPTRPQSPKTLGLAVRHPPRAADYRFSRRNYSSVIRRELPPRVYLFRLTLRVPPSLSALWLVGPLVRADTRSHINSTGNHMHSDSTMGSETNSGHGPTLRKGRGKPAGPWERPRWSILEDAERGPGPLEVQNREVICVEETLLRCSGGLANCPHCGSTVLESGYREPLSADTVVEEMECRVCGRVSLLSWKAAGWQEVRP